MADLLVIVPTRGRPDNARRVLEAWDATGGWSDADLMFAIDADDPMRDGYLDTFKPFGSHAVACEFHTWMPMVHKLDKCANAVFSRYQALGFAGDDHLPRTAGWARAYLDALTGLGTGIVYGDDRIQGINLPTQWAMTADIVRTLGRMVPAPVEHLYCDNSIRDLGQAAGCISYLPHVVIEHMHPVAGKSETDDGYRRVNSPEQYQRDREAYERWRREQLPADVEAVLRRGVTVGG